MLLYFRFPRFSESSTFQGGGRQDRSFIGLRELELGAGARLFWISIQGWSCLIDPGGFGVADYMDDRGAANRNPQRLVADCCCQAIRRSA